MDIYTFIDTHTIKFLLMLQNVAAQLPVLEKSGRNISRSELLLREFVKSKKVCE